MLHGPLDRRLEGRMRVEVPRCDRDNDQRGASADTVMAQEPAAMPLHRALGYAEDERDIAGRTAMRDEPEDSPLTSGEGRAGAAPSCHWY
jgi:hypothetical protein